MNEPKITNRMKARFNGHFTFKVEEPCPKCALHLENYYDDVECLCGECEEKHYQKEITVPWDLCKEIYKEMKLEANKEILRVNQQ